MVRFRLISLIIASTLAVAPFQPIKADPTLIVTATLAVAAVTGSIIAGHFGKKLYNKLATQAIYRLMPSLRPTIHSSSCTFNEHSSDDAEISTPAKVEAPIISKTNIFDAAAKGTPADIQKCLDEGASVNAIDAMQCNTTPLMYALRAQNKENINFLLTHSHINLHQATRTGTTALMLAAYYGNAEAVDFILQKTISTDIIKKCDSRNWNVYHYAKSRLDKLDAHAIEQTKIQNKIIFMLKERYMFCDFDWQIDLTKHNNVTVKKAMDITEKPSVRQTIDTIAAA